MTRFAMLLLVAATAVVLAGCGETYPDEEAHFGLDDKIRPYEITLDPPEAAPGAIVTAVLRYHMPRAAAAAATWRVALDFDSGLYEADETERAFVTVTDVDPATVDAAGFVTPAARFTVPDDIYATTTAIPDVLDDDLMLALLDLLPDGLLDRPYRKADVAAWLAGLSPADLESLPPDAAAVVRRLADLFACAVRFRVTLEDGMTVDVVRRLTVRHSGRLLSPNTNTNAVISRFAVGEIPRHDFDLGKLDEVADLVVWHEYDGVADSGHPLATVPYDPGHTYFMRVRVAPEFFTSPFADDLALAEQIDERWYYYRLDAPGSDHQFFVAQDGSEAEMWELDDDARIDPPGVGARYRVLAVVRDERGEWAAYHASPGSTTRMVEVVFVAP
ncbi:MAG: hypothetical protein R3D98_06855 [Candidatus Krumholzibacteriia bacterium]